MGSCTWACVHGLERMGLCKRANGFVHQGSHSSKGMSSALQCNKKCWGAACWRATCCCGGDTLFARSSSLKTHLAQFIRQRSLQLEISKASLAQAIRQGRVNTGVETCLLSGPGMHLAQAPITTPCILDVLTWCRE